MNKLFLMLRMIIDSRLRSDLKALRLARKGYTFYAWKLLEQAGIDSILANGATKEEIIRHKKIKNIEMLDGVLGFLVGESVLTLENKVYRIKKCPENFSNSEEKFIIENYEDSNTWTLSLFEHAHDTLVQGARVTNTGFDNKKFSKLWDGVMLGPLFSLRKIAIDKAAGLVSDSMKVADLGCGSGTFAIDFALTVNRNISIDGFDASEEMLKIAQDRATEISTPAKITFKKLETAGHFSLENKYDLIFSSLLINHIPPEKRSAFFESVADSLNSNGHFVIFQLVNKNENNRIFSDWLLYVTPTHCGFPLSAEYRAAINQHFEKVSFYLDNTIVIASGPKKQAKLSREK